MREDHNLRHPGAAVQTLREVRRSLWTYVALLPTFAFVGVFLVYPVVDAVIRSFYEWRMAAFYSPDFVGLSNYGEILSDPAFHDSLLVMLAFYARMIVVTFGITLPVTYLVYKLGDSGFGRLFRTLYVVPMMVPMMVIMLYWRLFYEPNYGMMNNLLTMIGREDLTRVWLGERETALASVLAIGFPWVESFPFLILLAGFQGIDETLHEACRLDGATPLQQLLRVDLPLIVPQARILLILGTIGTIQGFHVQLIMTDGGPSYSTTVPGLMMYKQAFSYGNLGYGAAIGVILFIGILLATVALNRLLHRRD